MSNNQFITNEDMNIKEKNEVSVINKIDKDNLWYTETKTSYHEQSLKQSNISFWISIVGACIGVLVIIINLVVNNGKSEIWVGSFSGAVIEAISALIFYISDKSSKKMTDFFDKFLNDTNIKTSIEVATKINDNELRNEIFSKISLNLIKFTYDQREEIHNKNVEK